MWACVGDTMAGAGSRGFSLLRRWAWLQVEEKGGSFCPFQGSEWQTEQRGNSTGVPTRGFVCHWFSLSWAWGGNTRAEGPEAILFCVSEGRAVPGQVGQSVSIFWI